MSLVGCGSDAEVHADANTNHKKVSDLRSVIEPPNGHGFSRVDRDAMVAQPGKAVTQRSTSAATQS